MSQHVELRGHLATSLVGMYPARHSKLVAKIQVPLKSGSREAALLGQQVAIYARLPFCRQGLEWGGLTRAEKVSSRCAKLGELPSWVSTSPTYGYTMGKKAWEGGCLRLVKVRVIVKQWVSAKKVHALGHWQWGLAPVWLKARPPQLG